MGKNINEYYPVFTTNTLKHLVADICEHYDDTYFSKDKYRRRTLALTDGYYLSILTGSHGVPSVEMALMKGDHFINNDDDFAIVNFYDMPAAVQSINRLCRYFESDDAIDIWNSIHNYSHKF